MFYVKEDSDEDKIPGEDDDIDLYGNLKKPASVKKSSNKAPIVKPKPSSNV